MSHPLTSRRTPHRQLLAMLATAATLTLVTACSSSTATPAAPPAASTSAAAPSTAASSAASTATSVTELKTASTSLGDIVVDGNGMALYMFTKDTQGAQTSACTGGCATLWPAALADSMPTLTGITGTVTMIPTASGGKQLALNGWPLYHYSKDKAAGDTVGQGVGSLWYVLDATGTPKKA